MRKSKLSLHDEIARNQQLNEKWLNRKERKRPKKWQGIEILQYPDPFVPIYDRHPNPNWD